MVNTRSAPPARAARSGLSVMAALLALLALAAAGYALWTASRAASGGATRAEVERLRSEMDALRAQIRQNNEPFGPTAGSPAPDTQTVPSPNGGARR